MNPWLIIGVLLAIAGAGAGGYFKGHSIGVDQTTLIYETKLSKQADVSNAILLKSKDDARDKERAMVADNAKLETENADKQRKIDGVRIANGRLLDATCGMYDRNGRPNEGGQGSADGMPGNTAPAFSAEGRPALCELPGKVQDIIRQYGRDAGEIAYDADSAALYAQAGHAYANTVDKYLGVK